jgi:hypothetical protein
VADEALSLIPVDEASALLPAARPCAQIAVEDAEKADD